MLEFDCPWCGKRPETEFHCGGESHVVRPEDWQNDSDVLWTDYLYMQPNTMGVFFERWCHSSGCGEWFNIARHTVSHEIVATYRMGAPAPDTEGEI